MNDGGSEPGKERGRRHGGLRGTGGVACKLWRNHIRDDHANVRHGGPCLSLAQACAPSKASRSTRCLLYVDRFVNE